MTVQNKKSSNYRIEI